MSKKPKGTIMLSKPLWIWCLTAVLLTGCSRQVKLFNEQDLVGWKPYLQDSNVDPSTVWSVQDSVLRCEGKPNGYLRTTESYSNYELHVEWRWPEKPTNSGILLHMSEPDKIWPRSIEAQLKHRNAGDFYSIDGVRFNELKKGRRVPKKNQTNEKEPGRWNTYDIICQDNTIMLYVNGLLQNTATHTSVNSGMIGLQSEGSPIEFRNITLTLIE
jgi:hypothetical protein